ncbi:adhesion G-protein coupled receptor G2-like [Aplochiton taeniatus]
MNDRITCKCKHLSFFAILLATPGGNISASDLKSLTYITNIGCGLSMFFLAIGLFMHCMLSRTKSSQATLLLVNLFVALFLLNLSFLVNESIAGLKVAWACVAVAAVMHYSMLATFTWFLLQAVHLYLQLWRPKRHDMQRYMVKMYVAGWVPSALVVMVLASMSKYTLLQINTDDQPVEMCWLTDIYVHYTVNIGYYAIVFVLTLGVFIIVVRQILFLRKKAAKGPSGGTPSPSSPLSILGLFFLLGITWGFAFFSYGALTIPSYYIFSILNSFQGFFLFIYYYKVRRSVGEQSVSSIASTTSTVPASNPYASKTK